MSGRPDNGFREPVIPDEELTFLVDELPPLSARMIRTGYLGQQTLNSLIYGYFDLLRMTFCSALALTCAGFPREGRPKASAGLITKALNHAGFVKRKKAEGDWANLAFHFLQGLIGGDTRDEQFGLDGELPRFLQDFLQIPKHAKNPQVTTIRNRMQHVLYPVQEPLPAQAAAWDNVIRSDIISAFHFWRHYAVGWVIDDGTSKFIRFEKERHGDLPLSAVADERWFSDVFSGIDEGVHPVVLLDEREQQVAMLSPFLWHREIRKPSRGNRRPGHVFYDDSLYHLTFMKANDGSISYGWWSHLFNQLDEQNQLTPVGAPEEFLRKVQIWPFRKQITNLDRDQKRIVFGYTDYLLQDISLEVSDPENTVLSDSEGTRDASIAPKALPSRFRPDLDAQPDFDGHRTVIDQGGKCLIVKIRSSAYPEKLVAKILRRRWLKATQDPRERQAMDIFQREVDFLRERRRRSDVRQEPDHFLEFLGSGTAVAKTASDPRRSLSGEPFYLTRLLDWNLKHRIREQQATRNIRRAQFNRLLNAQHPLRSDFQNVIWAKNAILSLSIVERIAETLAGVYRDTQEVRNKSGRDYPVHFVHRDLTPSNILWDRDGVIKLVGLGLAIYPRAVATGQLHLHFPEDPDPVASEPDIAYSTFTRRYCAPEVWTFPGFYSPKADVFSLGIILDEMLFHEPKPNEPRDTQLLAEDGNYKEEWESWQEGLLKASQSGVEKPGASPQGLAGLQFYSPPRHQDERQFIKTFGRYFCEHSDSPSIIFPQNIPKVPDPYMDIDPFMVIVKRACAPAPSRPTMDEFLHLVRPTLASLRRFLVAICNQTIDRAIESRSHTEVALTMQMIATAFGYREMFAGPFGGTLELLDCVGCQQEHRHLHCSRPDFLSTVMRLEEMASGHVKAEPDPSTPASGHPSLDPDESHGIGSEDEALEIDYDVACRLLAEIQRGLEQCPGLVDKSPRTTHLHGAIRRSHATPWANHDRFQGATTRWMQDLNVSNLVVKRRKAAESSVKRQDGGREDRARSTGSPSMLEGRMDTNNRFLKDFQNTGAVLAAIQRHYRQQWDAGGAFSDSLIKEQHGDAPSELPTPLSLGVEAILIPLGFLTQVLETLKKQHENAPDSLPGFEEAFAAIQKDDELGSLTMSRLRQDSRWVKSLVDICERVAPILQKSLQEDPVSDPGAPYSDVDAFDLMSWRLAALVDIDDIMYIGEPLDERFKTDRETNHVDIVERLTGFLERIDPMQGRMENIPEAIRLRGWYANPAISVQAATLLDRVEKEKRRNYSKEFGRDAMPNPEALESWQRLVEAIYEHPAVAESILASTRALTAAVNVLDEVYKGVAAPDAQSPEGALLRASRNFQNMFRHDIFGSFILNSMQSVLEKTTKEIPDAELDRFLHSLGLLAYCLGEGFLSDPEEPDNLRKELRKSFTTGGGEETHWTSREDVVRTVLAFIRQKALPKLRNFGSAFYEPTWFVATLDWRDLFEPAVKPIELGEDKQLIPKDLGGPEARKELGKDRRYSYILGLPLIVKALAHLSFSVRFRAIASATPIDDKTRSWLDEADLLNRELADLMTKYHISEIVDGTAYGKAKAGEELPVSAGVADALSIWSGILLIRAATEVENDEEALALELLRVVKKAVGPVRQEIHVHTPSTPAPVGTRNEIGPWEELTDAMWRVANFLLPDPSGKARRQIVFQSDPSFLEVYSLASFLVQAKRSKPGIDPDAVASEVFTQVAAKAADNSGNLGAIVKLLYMGLSKK